MKQIKIMTVLGKNIELDGPQCFFFDHWSTRETLNSVSFITTWLNERNLKDIHKFTNDS